MISNMEQIENFEDCSDTTTSSSMTPIFSKVYEYEIEKNILMLAEKTVPYGDIK
jgi:hypothetical protein